MIKNLSVLIAIIFSFNTINAQITKIAFGSCAHQDKPQPILNAVLKDKPSHFIFLGDNIYGDTDNMDTLKAKYQRYGLKTEFKKLLASTKIMAIWDDHDFGRNDAGKEYPFKIESKNIFLDFWKEPKNSVRRVQNGLYTSKIITEKNGKKIQIILLDNRSFRDSLQLSDIKKGDLRDFAIQKDESKTLLGAEQWIWLEQQLLIPADIRIVGSSTQFGIEYNGYESWANFPSEQTKMFELIKKTNAKGLFFISGDVHYAELSVQKPLGLYPIYDLTSSGITQTWDFSTDNKYRIGNVCFQNNYGLVSIDWKNKNVILQVKDINNKVHIEKQISFKELK